MDVNEPEVLKRRMYDGTGAISVERPEVVQDNDIDAPFSLDTPPSIPAHLMEEIHRPPSVDPEPEVKEQVATPIDAATFAEENPNSRFQLIDTAIHAPGTCIICKSAGGDGRQFLDLGIQVTWIGALYFCTFCVGEAAKLLGFELASNWVLAESELQKEISRLDDLLVEARTDLNASRILLRNCHCGDSVPSYSDVVDVSVVEEADESASDGIADGDKSGSIKESGDISENSGNNEPESKSKSRRRSSRSTSADE